ncbi:MAG: hypothetical protein WBK55_02565 [Alphaproteobacteria bacterium]
MKNLNELESRGLNNGFLLKHIEFKLEFTKGAAKAKYPGSFTSMMQALDNAIDDYSIDFLKNNSNDDVDVDDFLSYIAAKVDEVRKIAQPNTWPAQDWPELSDVIDEHVEKLRAVVQEIKAQKSAPQELAHSM